MAKPRSFTFDFNGKSYVINITIKQQTLGLFDVVYTVNINNQNEKNVKERYLFDMKHRAEYITKMDDHWFAVRISTFKSAISAKISVDGIYLHNKEPFIPLAPTPKWFYIYLLLFHTVLPACKFSTITRISDNDVFYFVMCWIIGAILSLYIARSDAKKIAKLVYLICTMYVWYWLAEV